MCYQIKFYRINTANTLWFVWECEDDTSYDRSKGSRWYTHRNEFGEIDYMCG